ncbi:hypothetical protein CFAM422_008269, partial [Trichoderma lentiforme]
CNQSRKTLAGPPTCQAPNYLGCSELYRHRAAFVSFCTAPNHDAKWGVGACANKPHPVVEPHAI